VMSSSVFACISNSLIGNPIGRMNAAQVLCLFRFHLGSMHQAPTVTKL
jgi:hypothetical protein